MNRKFKRTAFIGSLC